MTALLKCQLGHFHPYNVMRVLLAPAILLSGPPFFPCSTSTAVRPSFRVSEHVKLPISLFCSFNHDVLSNGALANTYILFTQQRSAKVLLHLHHFPLQIVMCSKRPLEMTGSIPRSALGTCSFHHFQRLWGHPPCSCSSLGCDICSQAEWQREKVSLSKVPWEDSSWAEPTVTRAVHIYINKSSTCSY